MAIPPEYDCIGDHYKLDFIGRREIQYETWERETKTEKLKPVLNSFVRNIERSIGVTTFPSIAFATAMANERCRCISELKVTGKVEIPFNLPAPLMEKAYAEYHRLQAEWVARPDYALRMGNYSRFAVGEIGKLPLANHFQAAIEATLASGIVGVWTAFESFSTDLWIRAVNLKPLSLGEKALTAQKPRQDEDEPLHPIDSQPMKHKANDAIKLQLLRRYEYNISDKIGTIVHRSRKFSFGRFKGLRHAYRAIFGEDAEKIFEKYPLIPMLEGIRNVLVHKGGLIDKSFKDRMHGDAWFGHLNENDNLPVNAEYLFIFSHEVLKFAHELLRFVDSWMQSNAD